MREGGGAYELGLYRSEFCGPQSPILLVLDAPYLLGTVIETVYIQARSGEIVPPVLAGLAVKGSVSDHTVGRVRDYTPARQSDEHLRQSPVWGLIEALQSETSRQLDDLLGGAVLFGEFLKSRVLPEIRSQCGPASDDIGIAGHSASGVFALQSLFSNTNPFSHFLLGSAGIGWYGEQPPEARNLASPPGATDAPVRIFQGVGGAEMKNTALGPALERGLAAVRELSAAFPDRVDLSQQVFADETHASVIAPLISAGVRTLYGHGASFMDDITKG